MLIDAAPQLNVALPPQLRAGWFVAELPMTKPLTPLSKMKKPQKKKRIRNPEQTRAKLLQATINLIAQKGADALSVKEAAIAANVSRAMAYHHFVDRDHLLQEAKTWVSNRLLESVVDLHPGSDINSMEERVEQVARLVLSNREVAKLLIMEALSGKGLDTDHPLYKLTVKALEGLKASGKGRSNIDIEMLCFILLGSVATLVMLGTPQENIDINVLAKRFTSESTQILRHGIFLEGKQRTADGSRAARASRPRMKAGARQNMASASGRTLKKTRK